MFEKVFSNMYSTYVLTGVIYDICLDDGGGPRKQEWLIPMAFCWRSRGAGAIDRGAVGTG